MGEISRERARSRKPVCGKSELSLQVSQRSATEITATTTTTTRRQRQAEWKNSFRHCAAKRCERRTQSPIALFVIDNGMPCQSLGQTVRVKVIVIGRLWNLIARVSIVQLIYGHHDGIEGIVIPHLRMVRYSYYPWHLSIKVFFLFAPKIVSRRTSWWQRLWSHCLARCGSLVACQL